MTTTKRFSPTGLLALEPSAFGMLIATGPTPPERKVAYVGDAAVVDIVGPLEHHAAADCQNDTYESIAARVNEACASKARAVVLRVDSPGGLVSGCFSTALHIREACQAAGKPLLAYVTGAACSAAYALVSQADHIMLAVGASAGSIGVLDVRVDATRMDDAMGLTYAFVTSGAYKAHGSPHLPLSDAEVKHRQRSVDAQARLFFDIVASRRPVDAQKIYALQADVLIGPAAVAGGLADSVGSLDSLMAMVGSNSTTLQVAADTTGGEHMSLRTALAEAAKGDGDEALRARRALAAFDDNEDKEEASDDADDDEPAANSGEGEDEEAKKAATSASAPVASAPVASAPVASAPTTEQTRLRAIEDEQRRAFLDTRPDLTVAQRSAVEGLPMANVRAVINAIPKAPKAKPVHAIAPAATRAEGQDAHGVGGSHLSPEQKAALDTQMGLSAITYTGVENTAFKVVLGAPVAKTAKATKGV